MFYLTEFFKAVTERGPVLFSFEDLHWADDSSLDAIAALVAAEAVRPALIVSAARPGLFERRPGWPMIALNTGASTCRRWARRPVPS